MVGYGVYRGCNSCNSLAYMEVTGTREAFMALISQPGFARKYSWNKSLVSQWASGERVPTLDKMEEVLLIAGSTVVKEKVWDVSFGNTYTQKQIDEIGDLIDEIRSNARLTQMKLRNKLRKEFNFNIREFETDQHGYTRADLVRDVANGKIRIVG